MIIAAVQATTTAAATDTDWKTWVIVIGLLFTIASFYVGRTTANRKDGREQGAIESDVKYIKESVNRIEGTVTNEIARTNGRIDEISLQLCGIAGNASGGIESAKTAHRRINEHLEREHGLVIERRKEDH